MAKKIKPPTGDDWWEDMYGSAIVWRNRMAVIALFAFAVAGTACLAVARLAPLKRVEVVTIVYNETTGTMRQAKYTDDVAKYTSDEGFIKMMTGAAIRARETWDWSDESDRKRIVEATFSPKLLPEYYDDWNKFKKDALIKKLGNKIVRRIQINSVVILPEQRNTVQVRFAATDYGVGAVGPPMEYVATLSYVFTAKPKDEEDIIFNAFGFQVMTYRKDAEIPVNFQQVSAK